MKIRYVEDKPTHHPSIFLAGPTPRDESPSWREDALDILCKLEYDWTVHVPERSDKKNRNWETGDWDRQVKWEWNALNMSTFIPFWICREEWKLPGLTTNDEWGYWKAKNPKKLLLGVPEGAPHTRYQIWWAKQLNIPVFNQLEDLLAETVKRTNKEAKDHWNPDAGAEGLWI